MITEFFLSLVFSVVDWFLGLFASDWEVPADIAGFAASANAFIAGVSEVGIWVPWVLLITCVGISIASWVIGAGSKTLLRLASHLPIVGGAG